MNSCIRVIRNLPKYEHITPYRQRAGVQNFVKRRHFFMGYLLYNMFHNQALKYLLDFFKSNDTAQSNHPKLPERKTVLTVPRHSTFKLHGSFIVRGARLRHKIPFSIRNAPTSFHFKSNGIFNFTCYSYGN